jgi:hypothetical protein
MTKDGYSGLCSTCDGRATCTYPRSKDRPVLFCEEFDGLSDNVAAAAGPACRSEWGSGGSTSEVRQEQKVKVTRKKSPYKGLCSTCDSQDTCTEEFS